MNVIKENINNEQRTEFENETKEVDWEPGAGNTLPSLTWV